MKRLVMTKLAQADGLSDAVGILVEMETSDGPLELRLTYEDAERLTAALQRAHLNQDAVLRALPRPDHPDPAH